MVTVIVFIKIHHKDFHFDQDEITRTRLTFLPDLKSTVMDKIFCILIQIEIIDR